MFPPVCFWQDFGCENEYPFWRDGDELHVLISRPQQLLPSNTRDLCKNSCFHYWRWQTIRHSLLFQRMQSPGVSWSAVMPRSRAPASLPASPHDSYSGLRWRPYGQYGSCACLFDTASHCLAGRSDEFQSQLSYAIFISQQFSPAWRFWLFEPWCEMQGALGTTVDVCIVSLEILVFRFLSLWLQVCQCSWFW